MANVVKPAKEIGAKFDPKAANECIAGLRQVVKACEIGNAEVTLLNDACSRVYAGTKKPGEACKANLECASSPEGRAYCVAWTKDAPAGSCVIRKFPAASGDVCDTSTARPVIAVCDSAETSELQCDEPTKTCKARIAIGESCATSADGCVKGAYCNSKTRRCEPTLAAGAECGDTTDCSSDNYCDGSSHTCVAKKAKGESCTGSDSVHEPELPVRQVHAEPDRHRAALQGLGARALLEALSSHRPVMGHPVSVMGRSWTPPSTRNRSRARSARRWLRRADRGGVS
jgi:hypothetical protein